MSEPSWPEVVRRMIDTNNKAVMVAPLSNVTRVQKVRAGTDITIGFAGDRVAGIANGAYVGGLLLIDKAEYDRVLAELKAVLGDGGGR